MKLYVARGKCLTCGEVCKAKASSEDDAEILLRHSHYYDSGARRCLFQGHVSITFIHEDDEPTPRHNDHDNSSVHPPAKKRR